MDFLLPCALLLLWWIPDLVSCLAVNHDVIYGTLGESVVLGCTYNCSSGWTRGYWRREKSLPCPHCHAEPKNITKMGDLCTLFMGIHRLSVNDTHHNYTCFSEESDNTNVVPRVERLVSLKVRAWPPPIVMTPQTAVVPKLTMMVTVQTEGPGNPAKTMPPMYPIKARLGGPLSLHCRITSSPPCEAQWRKVDGAPLGPKEVTGATLSWPEMEKRHAGRYSCQVLAPCSNRSLTVTIEVISPSKFGWAMVLAPITGLVAAGTAILVFCCCVSCNGERKGRPGSLREGPQQKEVVRVARATRAGKCCGEPARVAVRVTPADSQSDHEVPYADIMISVRGVSTPELTQVSYLTTGHHERWKEEAGPGNSMHTSRSADRLHVCPREVTRKMSTSSEYAVISYAA